MKKPDKNLTFKFFDFKWAKVPHWASETETMYRKWYLERYGYKSMAGLKFFLGDKQHILEAGCGLARDSKMFAEANPGAQILAVDQSVSALKAAARTLGESKNCQIQQADITSFSPDHNFDFISCDQVLHHTPEPGKTLRHLFNLLNKKGVLNFSVCRKKNKYRDLADDLIMARAAAMKPEELWEFSRTVTHLGKALYDLDIRGVKFENKKYPSLQRFIHDNLFRCWYNPDIDFELSVSSNYDWFSNNPRFNAHEVKSKIMKFIKSYKILRFYEDDATVSVSLKKL